MKKTDQTRLREDKQFHFVFLLTLQITLLKHMQKLKETERRNFSSKIAEFVMEGVSSS